MARTKRMKRLMMLGALLLIFALVGCNNVPQMSTPTTSTEPPVTPPEEPALHPDLIDSMVEYLQQLGSHYDMPTYGFGDKINFIAEGDFRPLHIKFDSSNYYFACAYYHADHESECPEEAFYCCADNYTWVRFDNEADILESYNGEELLVALQVNKAIACQDILIDEPGNTTMEHYQLYNTKFENGKNVMPAITFDKEYIFLSDSDKTNRYCCEDYYFFENVTLPCIELDGKCYLKHYLYTLYPDGSRSETNLQVHFGAYYDDLMEILITDQYSVTDSHGRVVAYVLLELGEFADFILSLDEPRVNPID